MLRRDASMKEWYRRIKKRRRAKIARVAVMRRLATIIWYMVKRQQPYRLGRKPATATAAMPAYRRTKCVFGGNARAFKEGKEKGCRDLKPRQPRVFDAPLTWLSLVELLASRARLRFTKQGKYSTRRRERRRAGCIGPSSSEEEALAAQGQPEKPRGPADSAGVALIEAACVRETVEPEYSVSGP